MAPTINLVNLLISRNKDRAASQISRSTAAPLTEARAIFARNILAKRDVDPTKGVLDPHDINNAGFFVLFALIGVAFVVTGIWFFFWAKNGGFVFKQNDWEDYKSTVLRRRGPNGTLLSNATKSTNLGGGSVYKDVADDDNTTVITEGTHLTDGTYMTGITAGPSEIFAREKRMEKKKKREREREERRKTRGEKTKRHMGADGVLDEEAELKAKEQLRSYRHEKAARVGGLNKQSEGSQWDGSTVPSEAQTSASSDLLSNRQSTPTNTPTKPKSSSPPARAPTKKVPGIRKVYSTADRDDARAEARRLAAQSRTARRDFSYERSVVGEESAVSESLLEGSETGTKSYHHPMPELRARDRQREREERRARRGGYRRGRGDDIDEELD